MTACPTPPQPWCFDKLNNRGASPEEAAGEPPVPEPVEGTAPHNATAGEDAGSGYAP